MSTAGSWNVERGDRAGSLAFRRIPPKSREEVARDNREMPHRRPKPQASWLPGLLAPITLTNLGPLMI